jgi:hypothetical protein
LRGDLGVFDQLAAQRERNTEEYWRSVRVNQTRSVAEKAWNLRDYAGAAYHYEQMLEDLTAVEKKKLEYSRKKWMSAKQR